MGVEWTTSTIKYYLDKVYTSNRTMADQTPETVPAPVARKAGRPRKYADPAPGEEVSSHLKHMLANRARSYARFHASPEAILERSRITYHARMEKYHGAVRQVEQIRAAVAA